MIESFLIILSCAWTWITFWNLFVGIWKWNRLMDYGKSIHFLFSNSSKNYWYRAPK
jgi:hypothetical protein